MKLRFGRPAFWRLACVLSALAAVPLFAAGDENVPASYAAWVRPWAGRPTDSGLLAGTAPKWVVTVISGEAEVAAVTNMTALERLELAYHIRTAATEIATNGLHRAYLVSNSGVRLGALRNFSEKEMAKFDQLLSQLPDDHGQLPPAGRRVAVQTWEAGRWHIRVYDGNQPSPELKALLRLLANPFEKNL